MTRFSLFVQTSLLAACMVGPLASMAEVNYSQPLKGTELPIGTLLEWATNYESDMQMFVLEKSADGLKFEDLGTVQAVGFSAVDHSYHFMDVGAASKRSFYRLRELTNDGTASLSAVTIFEKKLKNELSVVAMSRTEVTKEFKVTLDCTVEGLMNWAVIDSRNAEVETGSMALVNGLNDLRLDFRNLPVGNYKIAMRLRDETEQLVVNRISDGTTDKPNVASTKKPTATGRN